MPDPAELLAVARLLAGGKPAPSDAQLRRAVSTAYYAVFHRILRLAADRFVGVDQADTAAYRLLYRGFDHGRINEVCEGIVKLVMNKAFQESLGRQAVSLVMRRFATDFRALRNERHSADYDPAHRLTIVAVNEIIQVAAATMAALDAVAPEELADVLALMMVRTRT